MSDDESSSDDERGYSLFLPDDTLISDAEVISQGRVYDANTSESAVVTLNDTSILKNGSNLYRAIAVNRQNRLVYQQLDPVQEQTIIEEACRQSADVKPSFTRWTNMMRQQKYPEEATPAEQKMFGPCLLSATLVKHKLDAKRARDAASRKKRQNAALVSTDQAEKKQKTSAHIEITASGPGDEVMDLLQRLVGAHRS